MEDIRLLSPQEWKDYELIDCGDFEKLERFGRFVTARPEPQAIWHKSLSQEEWHKRADAYFEKTKGSDERGNWHCKPSMPESWWIRYNSGPLDLRMRLGLTSFKHVGIFPEQAVNWQFIADCVSRIGSGARVLNLFAYTGGASLAAKAAGADVTHVDSVRQVVTWSRENMERSGLSDIRWVVEDAKAFVRREVKRGRQYAGIILDPPAYGRGPKGEKWILESDLTPLLEDCAALLASGRNFLVLNLYSMGLSPLLGQTLVRQLFPAFRKEEIGELYFRDNFGKQLSLSEFYRGANL